MTDYRPIIHSAEALQDGTVALRIVLTGLKGRPVVTHRLTALDAAHVGSEVVRVALSAIKAQEDRAAEFPTDPERAR